MGKKPPLNLFDSFKDSCQTTLPFGRSLCLLSLKSQKAASSKVIRLVLTERTGFTPLQMGGDETRCKNLRFYIGIETPLTGSSFGQRKAVS